MLIHASYVYATGDRDAVHRRFKETGGAPPPGVEMIGRWHGAEGNCGFFLAETDDVGALARWLQDWTDLLSFEVTPVLTDAQFREVIG